MKKRFLLLLSLSMSFYGSAQSVEKFSIDNGGASVAVGGIEVLYTVGEVNVQEIAIGNIQVSEGFINPSACVGEVTAATQPKTADLDALGNATLRPEDVDNGSINTCGDVFLSFETTSYAQTTTISSPTDELFTGGND